jgi:hypothetical protein
VLPHKKRGNTCWDNWLGQIGFQEVVASPEHFRDCERPLAGYIELIMNPTIYRTLGLAGSFGLFLASAAASFAGEPTALELVKDGNRFVGDQSKDKVMEIRSEKSVGSLVPSVWYVTYYDPDTSSKRAEVKFGAGQQMGVKRTWRPFGGTTAEGKIMDLKQLKIDSDKAIQIATSQPLLEKLTLKATQLTLENRGGTPMWHVRIYAAKLSKPEEMVDIGEVKLSADTGQVVQADLKINKVD